MTPVMPYSISNVSLIPGTAFTTRKNNSLTRFSLSRKSTKHTPFSLKRPLPLSTSIRLFPQCRRGCSLHHISRIHKLSATGTDVAVEEPDSPTAVEDSGGASEVPSGAVGSSEKSSDKPDPSRTPTQSRRTKPVRKSEMPPVKNEELVPGATFTGKVRSIQPFGAFVDFGAFTDGLVHVSQLSDSYVKDVGSIVSVGQEVKVRLVEANMETQRISLTMRDSNDISELQDPSSSDKDGDAKRKVSKPRQKRDEKSSKFFKGQDLEGTVKNLTRSGAFISLPEGEEGFLPTSEESAEGFGNIMGESSLEVGQEVNVRVLRITRGKATLTMKKEEDLAKLDSQVGHGVIHVATNPFLLAFRKNNDIASFLDEREKVEKAATKPVITKTSEELEGNVNQSETGSDGVQDQPASSNEGTDSIPSAVDKTIEDDEASTKEADVGASALDDASTNIADNEEEPESIASSSTQGVDGTVQTIEKEEKASSEILAPEESASTSSQIIEKSLPTDEIESDAKSSSFGDVNNEVSSKEADVVASALDDASTDIANDKEDPKSTISSSTPSVDGGVQIIEKEADLSSEILIPEGSVSTENEIIEEAPPTDGPESNGKSDSSGEIASQITESPAGKDVTEDQADLPEEKPAAESEIPSASQVEDDKVGDAPEKNGSVTSTEGQIGSPSPKESITEAISSALVKQLREETGAGMMDCKKALSETGGDIVKAQEFLRKKGLASAEKKASRATAEGRIGSYIHDSRIGVLVEVNCETDFVSRGEIFKELVDDLAMQVAACPQVQYLVTEDVAEEIVNKEREIEMQKEDLLSKPEQIRSKIVEGRIRKRLEELALLEQPFIKNDKVVVKDWVKQNIATIGENIKVKRFVRYNLGEGLEKKSQDFAAEVAAQTAAKPVPKSEKEQPAAVEAEETVQKPPTVVVSAALVKQLREETGAGMMDCKKALSETGGDLEKAQEYLRKKGLSAADKKSSRLAAEGRIGSYIHDSRIGVLIEVNCETDFVGRSEQFKELVDDLAMQVVACPLVQFVSIEDIPESIVNKEKELEMQREDLQSKPENIRERIVEGRISKRLGELALLEQPFIKNDSVLVKDLVKQTVAALGENIKVRRFVRFTLGETVENETGNEA